MKEPVWVLPEVVRALLERLLAEFGGAEGVRDEGLLESALGRPQNQFAYGKPAMAELAAAYAFGLIRNPSFIDGNKRIGFATAVLFLEINGFRFVATEIEATVQTLALAAGEWDEARYAEWLTANAEPIKAKPKTARS